MAMTKESKMTMDIGEIRRMGAGDTPAGVSLIEMNVNHPDMTTKVLCRICPLSDDEAEFVMECVAREGETDWENIPEHSRVDFSYCEDPGDAWRAAFSQLLSSACVRVVDAIEAGDE